jgi:hypothetical protein
MKKLEQKKFSEIIGLFNRYVDSSGTNHEWALDILWKTDKRLKECYKVELTRKEILDSILLIHHRHPFFGIQLISPRGAM